MQYDIDIEEAHQIISNRIKRLKVESITLDQAYGRILASDLEAETDLPSEVQSAVDGFALGEDNVAINTYFDLKGYLKQGEISLNQIVGRQTMGVLTGGTLPTGTRAVVPHEKVLLKDQGLIVLEEIKPGNNIKQVGEDFHNGEKIASANMFLDPGTIGVLAAFGYSHIPAYCCPRVSILGLGENIVACSERPEVGQMRDSNSQYLTAFINQGGGKVISTELSAHFGTKEALMSWLRAAKEQSDLIIITGGSYAEDHGEARLLLKNSGAEILYWGTDIQPGSHNGFAYFDTVPVFSLSGNPAACWVGFSLFVLPCLRYMQGLEFGLTRVSARCINSFSKVARSRRLVRGNARPTQEGWEVMVLPGQKPSMLRSLINCNALIDMLPGHQGLEAGCDVSVILLEPITSTWS